MNSKRILVVDEEKTSEMVTRELEDHGHEVDRASKFGEEAHRDVYDAVITEVGNGYLREFNEIPESTIIYSTNDLETIENEFSFETRTQAGINLIDQDGEQEVFYVGKKNSNLDELDYLVDRI